MSVRGGHEPFTLRCALLLAFASVAPPVQAEHYACVAGSGEKYVSERPGRECYALLVSTRTPAARPHTAGSRSKQLLAKAAPYGAIIADAALSTGVDPFLLTAMIAVESDFDPAAVSPKGAVGLMQVMPSTGARFVGAADVPPDFTRRLADPALNVLTGARYLRGLLLRYPTNLALALAAYNAGEGAVTKYGEAVPPYTETRAYVARVMDHYQGLTSAAPAMGKTGSTVPRGLP